MSLRLCSTRFFFSGAPLPFVLLLVSKVVPPCPLRRRWRAELLMQLEYERLRCGVRAAVAAPPRQRVGFQAQSSSPQLAEARGLPADHFAWRGLLFGVASGHGCIALLRLRRRAVCTALAPGAPARCSARSSRVARPRAPGAASCAASPRRRAASSEAPWLGCCCG